MKRGFKDINWDITAHELCKSETPPPKRKTPPPKKQEVANTTTGVLVIGSTVTEAADISMTMRALDEYVPIAKAVGIPLVARRLPREANAKPSKHNKICRFMSIPSLGIAPMEWQYGGQLAAAPPVHLFRTDGIPFTTEDWDLLDEFEMAMLDGGPMDVEPIHFVNYIESRCFNSEVSFTLVLEKRYPVHSQYYAINLVNAKHLNGQLGTVVSFENGRIGLKFPNCEVL